MGHNRAGVIRKQKSKRGKGVVIHQDSLPKRPGYPTLQQHEMYNRLVKCYYKQFAESGEEPPAPPASAAGDGAVQKRYMQAKARFDRSQAKKKERQDAYAAFMSRPLQKPHMPVYDGSTPQARIDKGMSRYEAALAKWTRKMKERGYEV